MLLSEERVTVNTVCKWICLHAANGSYQYS